MCQSDNPPAWVQKYSVDRLLPGLVIVSLVQNRCQKKKQPQTPPTGEKRPGKTSALEPCEHPCYRRVKEKRNHSPGCLPSGEDSVGGANSVSPAVGGKKYKTGAPPVGAERVRTMQFENPVAGGKRVQSARPEGTLRGRPAVGGTRVQSGPLPVGGGVVLVVLAGRSRRLGVRRYKSGPPPVGIGKSGTRDGTPPPWAGDGTPPPYTRDGTRIGTNDPPKESRCKNSQS